VLRSQQPHAEVLGDPPSFPDYGDELNDSQELHESHEVMESQDFDPVQHPRGRAGRFVRVFHRTSHEAAREIHRTGRMVSKENTSEVFVSNRRHGQAEGYGEAVVELHVPREHLRLDDEFPDGEKHYAIHASHIGPENVGPHLRDEDARTQERKDQQLLDFLREMPHNSIEHMAWGRIVRGMNGVYSVQPDGEKAEQLRNPDDVFAAIRRIEANRPEAPPSVLNMETLKAIYDGFEHNGLHARADTASQGVVSGTILDEHDNYAGTFTREVNNSSRGVDVYHDTLKLLPEHQGKGFGTAFFEHSLAEYKKLDVARVSVTAASTVGGYQWARRGFDFNVDRYKILAYGAVALQPRDPALPLKPREGPAEGSRDVTDDEKFARAYAVYEMYRNRYELSSFAATRSYGDVPREHWEDFLRRLPKLDQLHAYLGGDDAALDGTFTSPAEIAMFGRDTHRWTETHDTFSQGKEMWLGKRFLLGAGWRGILELG
jgi:GNAT superfamily N-acetyltransferase